MLSLARCRLFRVDTLGVRVNKKREGGSRIMMMMTSFVVVVVLSPLIR